MKEETPLSHGEGPPQGGEHQRDQVVYRGPLKDPTKLPAEEAVRPPPRLEYRDGEAARILDDLGKRIAEIGNRLWLYHETDARMKSELERERIGDGPKYELQYYAQAHELLCQRMAGFEEAVRLLKGEVLDEPQWLQSSFIAYGPRPRGDQTE